MIVVKFRMLFALLRYFSIEGQLNFFMRLKGFPLKFSNLKICLQVLLLIWKTLLTILGGWKELREGKAAKRAALNLNSVEDTLLVASAMKSSSINGNDSEQNQGNFHLNFQ